MTPSPCSSRSALLGLFSPDRVHQAFTARLRDCHQLRGLLTHPLYDWSRRVRTPSPVRHHGDR
eukprot:15463269-Alexandrium_andersonii.AAC.1